MPIVHSVYATNRLNVCFCDVFTSEIASNIAADVRVTSRIHEVGDSDLLRACYGSVGVSITESCPWGRLSYYLGITICDVYVTHDSMPDTFSLDDMHRVFSSHINRVAAFRYVTLQSVRKMTEDGMLKGVHLKLRGRFTEVDRRPARSRLPVGELSTSDFLLSGPNRLVVDFDQNQRGRVGQIKLAISLDYTISYTELTRGLRLYGLDLISLDRDDRTIQEGLRAIVTAEVRAEPSVVVSAVPYTPTVTPKQNEAQKSTAELLTELLTDKEHELLVDCLVARATELSDHYKYNIHDERESNRYDRLLSTQRRTLALMQLFDKVFPGGHDILKAELGEALCNATVRMAENEARGPDLLDVMYEKAVEELMG